MACELMTQDAITQVRNFWQEAACGERLLLHSLDRNGFERQAAERYRLEPYIPDFAKFDDWQGKRVLEIGVGLGADHQRFVESGAITTGIDLTPRAIQLTERRLMAFNLSSGLHIADAENLKLPSNEFDLVYSLIIDANDFFREKNGWIYESCLELWNRDEAINQITVAHELARKERLDEAP